MEVAELGLIPKQFVGQVEKERPMGATEETPEECNVKKSK